MKKYINLFLVGFIIFLSGLIVLNFDLEKFCYSTELTNNFKFESERTTYQIKQDKKYKVKKAKYNENIEIEKVIDNHLNDEILVVMEHYNTSNAYSLIEYKNNEAVITFYNKLNLNKDKIIDIYRLGITSIKDKTLYNYKLLKYSKVKIYGNEKILERIDISE